MDKKAAKELRVLLTLEQTAILRKAAKALGYTPSELVRYALAQYIEDRLGEKFPLPELKKGRPKGTADK